MLLPLCSLLTVCPLSLPPSLSQELSLPPRASGYDPTDEDDHHGEKHQPIGLSRSASSKDFFEKEASRRGADAFAGALSSSSKELNNVASVVAAATETELNAD